MLTLQKGFPNKTQQMNRTWNIISSFRETKTMFAIQPSKFPWRNSHFQNNSRKHFTRYTGGAENAGQDITGQDNDGQEKRHAWVEIKT